MREISESNHASAHDVRDWIQLVQSEMRKCRDSFSKCQRNGCGTRSRELRDNFRGTRSVALLETNAERFLRQGRRRVLIPITPRNASL